MATNTTKNGSVCSRLLRTIVCALVMLCLLIAAVTHADAARLRRRLPSVF